MAKHKLDEKDIKKILAKYYKVQPSDVKLSVEKEVEFAEEWYNTYTHYSIKAIVSNCKKN